MVTSRNRSSIINMVAGAVLTIVVAWAVYYAAQAYILGRAERNIENVLLSQRGLHLYPRPLNCVDLD